MQRISDPSAEITEDGWERIGAVCSAGRRSVWMRLRRRDDALPHDCADNVEELELCAGREGDDEHLVIPRANPLFAELLSVLLAARFAVQT